MTTPRRRGARIAPFAGLTYRQSAAIRQVNSLARSLFQGDTAISHFTLKESGERVAQIEALLQTHFGLSWSDFAARRLTGGRMETRPLAG